MSNAIRLVRVNELVKRELGFLCERDGLAAVGALVTVTGVKVSPDLRHADVLVSVFGDDNAWRKAMGMLLDNRKRLQQELAANVKLKYTPVLRFHEDRTVAEADRVLRIINELELDADEEGKE